MSIDASTQQVAVWSDHTQERIALDAIQEISHIATLPEVTVKIIQLVEDPDSTAQDLNKIITNDPALGVRILKVVNSAFYGLPGQIASINRAIVLLGLNAVKNIAIAASLARLFRGGQICPGFDAKDLWTHSVAVATATKQLGDRSRLELPDEAFLAGLIHDVGIMVEIQTCRAKFVEAFDQFQANEQLSLRQAEQQVLGANHEHFGAALCKAWKLPDSLTYVTGFHHRPLDLAPQHRTLACLVHIADIVAARAKVGLSVSVDTREVTNELFDSVQLTQQVVDEVCMQLPEAIEQADFILHDAA